MEQISVMQMQIPTKQLIELGFIEVKKGLFLKNTSDNIKLWRDYRKEKPVSYAYQSNKTIDHTLFKEIQAINKIEQVMKGLVLGYITEDTSKRRSFGLDGSLSPGVRK